MVLLLQQLMLLMVREAGVNCGAGGAIDYNKKGVRKFRTPFLSVGRWVGGSTESDFSRLAVPPRLPNFADLEVIAEGAPLKIREFRSHYLQDR